MIDLSGLSQLAGAIKETIRATNFSWRKNDEFKCTSGEQPVSASAIPAERPGAETPRALTTEEVKKLIASYQQATLRAIKAGFDGVEIHGANTYIIQQFFSPHSNKRNDEWGGGLEKRFKFINDLVDAVTEAVDNSGVSNFIIGYRFSPEEFETPGIRLADALF